MDKKDIAVKQLNYGELGMNIIDLSDVASNWTMNTLKKSIRHMKNKNTEGQYDIAIEKEENILRSFIEQALGRPEAETQQVAA